METWGRGDEGTWGLGDLKTEVKSDQYSMVGVEEVGRG